MALNICMYNRIRDVFKKRDREIESVWESVGEWNEQLVANNYIKIFNRSFNIVWICVLNEIYKMEAKKKTNEKLDVIIHVYIFFVLRILFVEWCQCGKMRNNKLIKFTWICTIRFLFSLNEIIHFRSSFIAMARQNGNTTTATATKRNGIPKKAQQMNGLKRKNRTNERR